MDGGLIPADLELFKAHAGDRSGVGDRFDVYPLACSKQAFTSCALFSSS